MSPAARRLLAVAVGLLLLAGCRDTASDAGPTATLGTAAPTTSTTDPYAVPPVIDAAYVNRVLAGLDQGVGDMVRRIVAARTIPRDVADGLRAFYVSTNAWQLKIEFQEDVRTGFADYKPNPGNQQSMVTDLIKAGGQCIFAKVSRDYSAVISRPDPAFAAQWVALKRVRASDDPDHRNPTGWGYIYDGFQPDRSAPTDPCAGS